MKDGQTAGDRLILEYEGGWGSLWLLWSDGNGDHESRRWTKGFDRACGAEIHEQGK